MLKFNFEYRGFLIERMIFVFYVQTEEDHKNLERLVSETRYIAKISEETGLRILRTFMYRDNLCAVTYIGKKLKINESQKRKLCTQARQTIRRLLAQ